LKENELKCKLEEMAAGMGYEVRKKFKKEMDPIYKIFQILIIFGFLTVFTIMGTYIASSFKSSEKIVYVDKPIVTEKIVYVDKPIVTEKIVYVDRYIDRVVEKIVEKPIIKEVIKYVNVPKTKGLKYQKSIIRNGRKYKYYRKDSGDTWEFYTIAKKIKKIKKGKKCQK